MINTEIVIPGKDDQVCFHMRQTTGAIDDAHAKLLGMTFATLICRDANKVFVKSVFDTLSKHYIREMFNETYEDSTNQLDPE